MISSEQYGIKGFNSRFYLYYAGINITLAAGVVGIVPFDTVVYDSLDECVLGANARFEPKHAGYYFLRSNVFITNVALLGAISMVGDIDGANSLVLAGYECHAGLNYDIEACGVVYLIPGQTFRIYIHNNTLGNIDIQAGITQTTVCGHRLS